jgi:hypothetical protein
MFAAILVPSSRETNDPLSVDVLSLRFCSFLQLLILRAIKREIANVTNFVFINFRLKVYK